MRWGNACALPVRWCSGPKAARQAPYPATAPQLGLNATAQAKEGSRGRLLGDSLHEHVGGGSRR